MKKLINIVSILPDLTLRMLNRIFMVRKASEKKPDPVVRSGMINAVGLKCLFVLFLLFYTAAESVAPSRNYLVIHKPGDINPFEPLMHAIGMVETMGNTMAFNEYEGAAGIFQIRQVRIDEYNRQTNSCFRLSDMFDYENSRKVFLHFASKIGPYNFEKIAKSWNGSGPMTEFYWRRIRSQLQKTQPA